MLNPYNSVLCYRLSGPSVIFTAKYYAQHRRHSGRVHTRQFILYGAGQEASNRHLYTTVTAPHRTNPTVGDNALIIYDGTEKFVPINLSNLEVGTYEVRLCLRFPVYNDSCQVVSIDVVGKFTYIFYQHTMHCNSSLTIYVYIYLYVYMVNYNCNLKYIFISVSLETCSRQSNYSAIYILISTVIGCVIGAFTTCIGFKYFKCFKYMGNCTAREGHHQHVSDRGQNGEMESLNKNNSVDVTLNVPTHQH